MTREEAIKKCHGIAYPETLVQALEAMGLIKFDVPPKPETVEDRFRAFLTNNLCHQDGKFADSLTVEEFIMALDERGFTVRQAGIGEAPVTRAPWIERTNYRMQARGQCLRDQTKPLPPI